MIKVACLGAGYFSQFHIDGWRRLDNVTLVGVADQDLDKATASQAPAFDSLDAMLDATNPDVVDIILPPAGHADAIKTCLMHNPKVIICQKPFCTSLAEAREMADLATAQNIPLIVHENFRFQPWFRTIKDAIAAGDIGQPLQATFRLRPGDGQGPAAYLARQPYFQDMARFLVHETGIHFIDTFRFLFGDPTSVYADIRTINPAIAGEDAGFILFEHPNGVRTVFDGNRCLDHAAENTRCTMGEGLFEGTQGTLTLNGDGSVQLRKFGTQNQIEVLAPSSVSQFGGDCTFHLQSHVVDFLEKEFPLENQATTYLTVIELEEAVYLSAESHSKVRLRPNVDDAEQDKTEFHHRDGKTT